MLPSQLEVVAKLAKLVFLIAFVTGRGWCVAGKGLTIMAAVLEGDYLDKFHQAALADEVRPLVFTGKVAVNLNTP
jgi:hypothetical protein